MKVHNIRTMIENYVHANGVRGTAKLLGVSCASVSYWKNGKSTPSIDVIQKLIDFGEIEVSLVNKIGEVFTNPTA